MKQTITIASNSREAKIAIAAVAHKDLDEEIGYRIDLQHENEDFDGVEDYLLALLDAEEWAENTESRVLLNKCRRALIALGRYRIITPGELARIQTFGGCKKFDFQLSGQKYVWQG